ncbi:hypothetical protein NPIL_563981 [Nephila pilipes]|uniref:Uncharacterized protein n=1 Tax=Nephila pilipes TaxID=299642 RepID=A0A8X6U4Y1_NEPPI|nr:hypothetical protein NPIL_563981 [Nephila pilipes]
MRGHLAGSRANSDFPTHKTIPVPEISCSKIQREKEKKMTSPRIQWRHLYRGINRVKEKEFRDSRRRQIDIRFPWGNQCVTPTLKKCDASFEMGAKVEFCRLKSPSPHLISCQ